MNTVLGVSKKMAAAVSIMILSPICLIQLGGYAGVIIIKLPKKWQAQ